MRDVRPTTVESGDIMIVETDPSVTLVAGAPTRVVLVGTFVKPGGDPVEDRRELTARVSGRSRVLVDIDDAVAERFAGRTVFVGTVVVEQKPPGSETHVPVAETGTRSIVLQMFPSTARKVAHELFGNLDGDSLVQWLGIEVEHAESGSGLKVISVRAGFEGIHFLHRYDCGKWRDGRCKGGPDFKVHLDEAKSQGYTDDDTFHWVDLDDSGYLDRHEIHEFLVDNGVNVHEDATLPPAPAAAAGIETGDVITAVDGKPTPTITALMDAWETGEGATATVTYTREGQEHTASIGRYGRPETIPVGFLNIIAMILTGMVVILAVPVLGGIIVVWERKIAGRIQSRPGPNRVGPNGWLQWLADGIKLIVKEDIIPTEADPVLFRLSPLLVFSGVFLTFVVLPFSPVWQVADLNIGVLYLLSVTSIVVIGVIMGGWASNSKWSLLGGMRSAAQIISYELPASLAILTVVIMVGSLSMQDMVRSQGGVPWEWNMFHNPFAFVCFFVFFISALAEGNRTPFDLPEAESELVAGYNTEYSGFRFSIFALAEWVNLIVIGAFATTVFLGGWNIPFVDALAVESWLVWRLLAFVIFSLKVGVIIFVCIWIRWTLPRFRVDHMMNMCWKYFMPITLTSLLGAGAWVWLIPEDIQPYIAMVIFAIGGVGVFAVFLKRVNHVRKSTTVWDLRGA